MASLTQYSAAELREKLERARSTLARARAEGEVVTGRAIQSVVAVAGGAMAGALRSKMGDGYTALIPGTKVDVEVGAGTILTGLAVAGVAGKHSDLLNAFGSGMLAAYAAKMIGVKLETKELEKRQAAQQAAAQQAQRL